MKNYHIYLLSIMLLVLIGLLMIYSSSMVWAMFLTGNKFYYLLRQLVFLFISFIAFFFFKSYDYKNYKKISTPLFFISLVLLIIVLIPHVGIKKNGAKSWLGFKDLSIQPSEIMKISLIILTSKLSLINEGCFNKFKNVFLYSLLLLFVFFLIMLEPDFGSGFIMISTIFIMMFKDLLKTKYIVIVLVLSLIGFFVLIKSAPYRLDRITSYLDPFNDPLGTGFQSIQSLFALGPFGLFGCGLFKSRQKFFYLPEPQTDFIFAILVEELGMIGGFIVVLLFYIIISIGYHKSYKMIEPFGKSLIFGFTTLIFIQVFINIGVVIGLLPVTGVTLPLISYGGSSLIITMSILGINYNILKQNNN